MPSDGFTESITECRNLNNIVSLADRRAELDTLFLRKVEAGLFEIKLNKYIRFSSKAHNTRGNAISWVHRTNAWKFSYFNRIKDQVKVSFPP